jgi:hypothetical protein
MRLYMRAAAVATPILWFMTLLLLARGEVLWVMPIAITAITLFLTFPFWITDKTSEAKPGAVDAPTWIQRVAKYLTFYWFLQLPEVKTLLNRVTQEQLLWDWHLIVPAALVTLSYVWIGLRNVTAVTDEAIYAHFAA